MANEEKKTNVPATPAKAVPKKSESEKVGLGKRIAKWFRELRSELKKVVWPTPKQILNNTVVALVVMTAAAVVVWGFDTLAQAGVMALISVAG